MQCCCVKTLNLCNVPVCGVLELDKVAGGAESGVGNNYTLVIDFLGTQITLSQEQTEGENIRFAVLSLNENFQYTGQVFDSTGELVKITVDTVEYDCIKFKTVMNVSI